MSSRLFLLSVTSSGADPETGQGLFPGEGMGKFKHSVTVSRFLKFSPSFELIISNWEPYNFQFSKTQPHFPYPCRTLGQKGFLDVLCLTVVLHVYRLHVYICLHNVLNKIMKHNNLKDSWEREIWPPGVVEEACGQVESLGRL